MSDLNVILGPRGLAGGVLDALVDLSAAGYVNRFIWLTDLEVDPKDAVAYDINAGSRSISTLGQIISGVQGGFNRIRVCVVVCLIDAVASVESGAEQDLVGWLEERSDRVVRTRVVAAYPNVGLGDGVAAKPSWHNLVVSPEDLFNPTLSHSAPFDVPRDAEELGVRLAPVIAGLLGMWTGGSGSGPFDEDSPKAEFNVRLVRSFHRRFRAGEVDTHLRQRFFDMSQSLPLPSQQYGQTQRLDDSRADAARLTAILWARHSGGFWLGRIEPPTGPLQKSVGWLRALWTLIRFLGRSVLLGVRSWWTGKLARLSGSVADWTQRVVYGRGDSAYVVTVGGRQRRVILSESGDSHAAFGETSVQAEGANSAKQQMPTLAALWRDYKAAVITLADGSEADSELRPAEILPDIAVSMRGRDIVPDPLDQFEVPEDLRDALGITEPISAANVQAEAVVRQELEDMARSDDGHQGQAREALQALKDWTEQRSGTLAWRFGLHLVEERAKRLEEIKRLFAQREALAEQAKKLKKEEKFVQRFGRSLAIFTWVMVIVMIAVALSHHQGWIDYASLASWLNERLPRPFDHLTLPNDIFWSGLTVWAMIILFRFWRNQRRLFHLLNLLDRGFDEDRIIAENIGLADRDRQCLESAYHQYLAWSDILGEFLTRPYGRQPASGQPEVEAIRGLPKYVQTGSVVVKSPALNHVAGELRRLEYPLGWLDNLWERVLKRTAQEISQAIPGLGENPHNLYGLRIDNTSHGVLRQWRNEVISSGFGVTEAEEKWAAVIQSSDDQQLKLLGLATAQVEVDDPGGTVADSEVVIGTVATEQIRPGRADEHAPRFDGGLLMAKQRAGAGINVRGRWLDQSPNAGLGTNLTMTEWSDLISVHETFLGSTVNEAEYSIPTDSQGRRESGQEVEDF